ncbi:hypothetical protein [Flavobacterium sp.]|uniref:hypothetical protein n=1 Tax=Flavobacterium sp. TaxID=239 RepID=UPI003753B152
MKNRNSSIVFMFFLSSLLFVSCDNEPLDPTLKSQLASGVLNPSTGGSTPTTSAITGTYLLTAFNSSVPTDLNGDGTSSTNQMSETTCFNNSNFILNANNTFISNSKGIDIDATVTPNVLTCFTDPDVTGTWVLNGTTLTTTYVDAGITYNDVFSVIGNTLVLTAANGSVVGMVGGNPVTLTADLTLIYSKQ